MLPGVATLLPTGPSSVRNAFPCRLMPIRGRCEPPARPCSSCRGYAPGWLVNYECALCLGSIAALPVDTRRARCALDHGAKPDRGVIRVVGRRWLRPKPGG